MLGNVIELSIVVKDLEEAIDHYTNLFGLKVHRRGESKEFGFRNAILPTGIGHIELLQPTDPTKHAARYLEKHGEGVYLIGFETQDISKSVQDLRDKGVKVTHTGTGDHEIAWVHPAFAHGVFVELRHREEYK